jgi:hypothetical protein
MRAITFQVFGEPAVLELAEVAPPAADDQTAVVRVVAVSINPSDVKNVAGGMKQTTLPRIPGRDFSGVVEGGPAERIGAEVWGTGGDAGSIRDGSHAELIAVPVASLRRCPPSPLRATPMVRPIRSPRPTPRNSRANMRTTSLKAALGIIFLRKPHAPLLRQSSTPQSLDWLRVGNVYERDAHDVFPLIEERQSAPITDGSSVRRRKESPP